MNYADKLKSQFTYNRKQVLFLTGVSEHEYRNFQVDTASAWIERYCPGINHDLLIGCSLFWKWWNYQWNDADDQYILAKLYAAKSKYIAYRQLHQYVFDMSDTHAKQMMDDFKSMRYDFEIAIKNNQ